MLGRSSFEHGFSAAPLPRGYDLSPEHLTEIVRRFLLRIWATDLRLHLLCFVDLLPATETAMIHMEVAWCRAGTA